jgi:5-methyltetrahydrofolate--homocysteine methyltransferase
LQIDWKAAPPPAPIKPGVHVFESIDLNDLCPVIDWTPFFQVWELAGSFPAILDDPKVGAQATEVYEDARVLLDTIISEKWLTARAVVGLFAAASAGDDIEVYQNGTRSDNLTTIHTLRQQMEKLPGRPNMALADFIAPKESGIHDWVGMFAVTAGIGLEERVKAYEADQDDYHSIMMKALADRLAEALAEYIHQKVRKEIWGYAPDEALDAPGLIAEKFQGIRPAPGYPACPDHTEKGELFRVLGASEKPGITLTESFAMLPAASVSGYFFAHAQAAYFGVGRIGKDQVEDYARRKGMGVEEVERWLATQMEG